MRSNQAAFLTGKRTGVLLVRLKEGLVVAFCCLVAIGLPFGFETYPGIRAAPLRVATLSNPLLFVTQVPIPGDFTTIGSTFGNQSGDLESAGRGGDLYILYPDGTLKNLTAAAGFGMSGLQGTNAIAVREPSVHWSGNKAVFSMVQGAPRQYEVTPYYWQIYEVTGLGKGDRPVVTKVPFQPSGFNNVSPLYGSDDRIIFTSDRPRNGERHLYPQLDEYEEAPTTTGLWSLDPVTGDLRMLNHSPSGAFTPILDSYGRVVFTRWDHLQRDQQADHDALSGNDYGTFDYADESAGAARLNRREEVFPEPRAERTDLLAGTNLAGHSFNQFSPWQINEDGTEEETLNHIGRHELYSYFDRSLTGDSNLREFIAEVSGRFNPNSILNLFQVKEDPGRPGVYLGISAPEFQSHASGQIVSLSAPPDLPADRIQIEYLTRPESANVIGEEASIPAGYPGHFRNPLRLSDGSFIAVHTSEARADRNDGTRSAPVSRYRFRLKMLRNSGGYWTADTLLTPGIQKSVSYYDPDVLVSYSGDLWELDPVEVRARPRPARRIPILEAPERTIFASEQVDPAAFQDYLRKNQLAVVVSRDVTTRDYADRQQPYNLRVSGGTAQTLGAGGKVYDISGIQFFQADQLRGLGGIDSPRPGRRVLARPMHAPEARNPVPAGASAENLKVAGDGSVAAFVPARRALSWQLTDRAGTAVVRERYWLTFQPGEIRLCTSCHGLNTRDQAGRGVPTNSPEALRQLLQFWKATMASSGQ